MSNEDVIELGSSDEETQPAKKRSKPMPNAMVCIPRQFNDVTITPSKPNPIAIAKGLGKAITVKKIVAKNVTNSRPNIGLPFQLSKQKYGINPLAKKTMKTLPSKPNLQSIPPLRPGNPKATYIKPSLLLQKPIKIQQSGPLNQLPSSITVKKTLSNRTTVNYNIKNKQPLKQTNEGEVLTVELDDDEAPALKSSPQWYVRPEDQVLCTNKEEENNKEPETSKLIEITIEDSPVKPPINKQTHTVGAELSITIEDSPVKVIVDKNKSASGSDNEIESNSSQTPHSKKQLVYPKDMDNNKTIEIEIEPHLVSVSNFTDSKDKKDDTNMNKVDGNEQNTNIKNESESIHKSTEMKTDSSLSKDSKKDEQSSDLSDFHPIYRRFIDLCFQLENSEDMKTIVEKKIKGYYKQVPKDYTESEEFTEMVTSKMLAMKASPEKMYLYIKDVVDELNSQRKLAKAQPVLKEVKNEETVQVLGDVTEYDSKRQRQIRKLDKTIKKLHKAIKKLDAQEVDFDDEEDSVYLLTYRYKERLLRVHAKLCQLTNTKMPSEPRIQIDPRPGQPSGAAKRLEKWIYKKVPIGKPLPFPDFHDVVRCVREANEEDRLNYNEAQIMEEARDLFIRCGRKLQRRRQENEWRTAASWLPADTDPAEKSDEIKQKLIEHKNVFTRKVAEIVDKYVNTQDQLKLEGEEIGEKEAEESPVESEEEEVNDDSVALENTEKRKERLKRLLQEKSKKIAEEKDSPPADEERENMNDENIKTAELENISKTEPNVEETENKGEEDMQEKIHENNHEEKHSQATETLTLSDDSNNLESDIDELHLLQKLRSGDEDQSSSIDSSDSDSPIAISDSLESNDNEKITVDDDVISIENSSYSENEAEKDFQMKSNNLYLNGESALDQLAVITPIVKENVIDIDLNTDKDGQAVIISPVQTNNDEYNDAVENILLASSEDSNNCDSQEEIIETLSVNLRDDFISIDETVIGNGNNDSVVETGNVLNTSCKEIEGKSNAFEDNVDINESTNNTVSTETITELKNIPQTDTVQNVNVVLAEVQKSPIERMDVDQDSGRKNPIERMDVDQDSARNDSNVLDSLDQNAPDTPSLKA